MTLHLLKLAVGVESVDHLATLQKNRLLRERHIHKDASLSHVTRSYPRYHKKLVSNGSIYWVIKRQILVRQQLLGFEPTVNGKGGKACRIILDIELFRTVPRRHRPFQGWRYLADTDAPADLTKRSTPQEDLPIHLVAELRELGIL